ncbi:MAG: hypothetical protein LBS84_11135 [Clostridiales bacterium]|jgi:hypothetical protein|nr:hypothetical protein [Clostridiales bacterium]
MNRQFDLNLTAKILNILIIGAAACLAIAALMRTAPDNAARQAGDLEEIIRKAAVQCYALEGAFPEEIYYLKNYGVVFNEDRFYFHYEFNGISNYLPNIYVVPR